jgi:Ferritin-like
MSVTPQDLANRQRLVALLDEAAEIEHMVLCQYLYAAFSLKRHPEEGGVTWAQLEKMRQWGSHLMLIARQEMEHLGLVANLLLALGEAPHFQRPNFPVSPRYYKLAIPSMLEGFGESSLLRFIDLERPAELSGENEKLLDKLFPAVLLTSFTIGALYDEIKTLFEQTAPEALFLGSPRAQVTTSEVIPVPIRGITLPPNTPLYNVLMRPVTDRDSALATVHQIVTEGEGAHHDQQPCHFTYFLQIFEEFTKEKEKDPQFAPARNVVINPQTSGQDVMPPQPNTTLITNLATNAVSLLFDGAYETMMLMLIRFFAHTSESSEELAALQKAVFFPMMTVIIRPLGEVLTLLPATEDLSPGAPTAGPTFATTRAMHLLPDRAAAWGVLALQLEALTQSAKLLLYNYTYPKPVQDRLTLVYENLARISFDFNNSRKQNP